ncbi:MAG: MAPEG family protein [Halioglobus sp.]|nr:MAPEG family protein [Halioglobus sp.]
MQTVHFPEITILFAAIFGLLHVVFTLRVGGYRFKSGVSLGDGGDEALLKRIRGHANFTENVPIGLLLILLNELTGLASQYVMAMAGVFLLARVMHYFTIVARLPFLVRPLSMLLTLGVIATAAILLLF